MALPSRRDRLLRDGHLVDGEEPDVYRFATDVAFASPSAAAAVVVARSASGPREWKLRGTGQFHRDWRAARVRVDRTVNDPANRFRLNQTIRPADG